ncbi:MAG: YihY/virulence factor BrkB family protein, partial [Candidatus Aminicenantes bacterium]|nr:YihY/virulence factor BrkB family protein [Candidatus Aminicenantes bacterium]
MKERKFRFIRVPPASEIKNFFKHYLGGLYKRADEHHIFLFGGGLAFSLFLCIVPFILIIFSILGSILQAGSVELQISIFIGAVVPYQEYADYARQIISSRITEFIEFKTLAGLVGGFGLLFAASGLFSSMRTVLNNVFGAKKNKSVVAGKLRDFGMILFVVVFVLLATVILPAIDILKNILPAIDILKNVIHEWAIAKFFQISEFQNLFITVVSFLIIFIAFYLFYRFIPYAKIGRKVPAVSAFWAAVFWEMAKRLFGYYLYNFASLNKIYGTYTLIVVLAFWIYYSSVIFIIGAE